MNETARNIIKNNIIKETIYEKADSETIIFKYTRMEIMFSDRGSMLFCCTNMVYCIKKAPILRKVVP